MVVNTDIEQTKVIEHLTAALSSSRALRHDALSYLIDMALIEAHTAFTPPKVTLVRKGQPPTRLL